MKRRQRGEAQPRKREGGRERDEGGVQPLSCLVWLGVIWSNLPHVNLSEQQEPDYPSNNGHTLIC